MTRLLLVAAVAIVVVLAAVGVGTGAGAELHVYPGAGTPIQTAIDGAGAGDTIYVHAGLYYENLDVGKRLTLIGDGADVVTVRAAEASDHVFEVTADWVNISGFTVTGTTGYRCAGIYLTGTDHCNISENNASGNGRYGIRLHDSSNNMLMNNDANSNGDSGYIGNFGYGYGICLYSSSNNNMLANNTASNNRLGIYLSSSSNNTLHGNSMSGNRYNFGVHGNSLSHYIHVIDTSNTVDGELIYYWVCQQDKMITGNAGFVGVVNSTNITIKDVTLTNNRHGVLFAYTENSRIENVTASNNRHGIYLLNSSNNTLNNNNANSNGDSGWLGNIGYGIYLLNSSNNTLVNNDANLNDVVGILLHEPSNYNMLVGNNASNNEFGIYLSSSSNNTLTNNTASNNRHGILLYESSNYNTLSSNTANLNDRGIILCSSSYYNACPSNNILTDNNASNNEFGIFMLGSRNNTLTSNTANSNRGGGIYLSSSSNNTLHHNNLIDNAQNAHDSCTNTWDSGSEGNYYSDYNGTDGDGIGNDPYPIPGGGTSIDRFPLMHPWTGGTLLKGDLNSDNILTPADAAIALEIAAGSRPCDPTTLAAADVSGDGQVTSLDALMILQAAAGKIEL